MEIKSYTTPDIYDFYKEEGGDLEYGTYTDLVEEFNKGVFDDILLQGNAFNMGFRLSTLEVVKIPRNYKGRSVDWKESYKLRDQLLAEGKKLYDKDTGEGEKWLVYHTDPWYCRYAWAKVGCMVPNKGLYEFVPTRGKKGNKKKLYELLTNNPVAHARFRKVENVTIGIDDKR